MILKNKKIVISAGASGIGWATAKVLDQRGAKVFVCDIDEGRVKAINSDKKNKIKAFVSEGALWLKAYLHNDVEELQRLKQHHVHMVNEKTNEREPLAACRRKDKPKECKANFPLFSWLVSRPVILCEGLLTQMGLPVKGRQSKLGSMHGPMNN